jgi:hypothetical protein
MGCKWCTFGNFGPLTTWRNREVADVLPEEPTEYGHSPLLSALLELGYLEEIQKGLFARGKPLDARSQDQNRLSALARECRTWAREEEYLQLMLKDNQLYRCQDEERDLFWDLSVELVEANRHSREGCKLHHHFVWTDTDEEDNEPPRGLTVRMIRSPTELLGPPALDIEDDARDAQEPAPVGANEVLGDNWGDHLGWDADANIAAAEAAAPAEDVLTDPRIFRGLEELEVLNAVHEMKRQVRFKSNGGEEPTLAVPSLVERVAIAILHDKPERAPEEVLREVKRSVLNLRLEYRENVERALQENLAIQEEKEEENGEGIPIETRLDAFELTPTPSLRTTWWTTKKWSPTSSKGNSRRSPICQQRRGRRRGDRYEIEPRSFTLTTGDSSSSTSRPSGQIRFRGWHKRRRCSREWRKKRFSVRCTTMEATPRCPTHGS